MEVNGVEKNSVNTTIHMNNAGEYEMKEKKSHTFAKSETNISVKAFSVYLLFILMWFLFIKNVYKGALLLISLINCIRPLGKLQCAWYNANRKRYGVLEPRKKKLTEKSQKMFDIKVKFEHLTVRNSSELVYYRNYNKRSCTQTHLCASYISR